jgi:hypothetical protein
LRGVFEFEAFLLESPTIDIAQANDRHTLLGNVARVAAALATDTNASTTQALQCRVLGISFGPGARPDAHASA